MSAGERSASDVWSEAGGGTLANETSTADGTSDLADPDGVRQDDARLQSVPDTDITVDPDGVREDDARLQSVRDDWDGVPTEPVTVTYRPSGSVEFRGDLYSSDNKTRVIHPSEGVGFEFGKPDTDVEMLNDRIKSLPADIQEALKRGDDNVRVSITASASREGPPEHNQELSEDRGQNMKESMRDLGVKSDIHVTAVGEDRAAKAGARDDDNPADRVATFKVVAVEQRAPQEVPADDTNVVGQLKFVVPETGHEFAARFLDLFPVALSAEEAVLALAELHTESVFLVDLGVAFPIASAVIGQWVALGSGIAAGRELIAKDEMDSGYSVGVVLAADGRDLTYLGDHFLRESPTPNPNDQDAARIAQTVYNVGLVAGFKQAREFSTEKREGLLADIESRRGDESWRGERNTWSTRDWVNWYTDAAATFRDAHVR